MIVQIFTMPDSEQFLRWQIAHYTQRMTEAKTTEEKSFGIVTGKQIGRAHV